MTGIIIKTKQGTRIPLCICGTQEDPQITTPLGKVGSQTVYGAATIQESLRSAVGSEAGLLFSTPQNIYVQCAEEMPRIREAIATLPHEGETHV